MVLIVTFSTVEMAAQDIHFTQFYASPITLNPAMTGMMNGCYRGAVNYRNQYPELYSYSTIAASFDMPMFRGMLGSDFAGFGVMLFNDRQGTGSLNNLSIMGSAAYHKALDRSGRIMVSIGVQGGWVHKSINFAQLTFESQLVGQEFDITMPNGEAIEDNAINYLDLRMGGMITARASDQLDLYGGFGYYHITEPTESFLGSDNKLGKRLVGHAGATIRPSSKLSISPNVIYMTQTAAQLLVIGANFGFHFNDSRRSGSESALYLGGAYRHQDALTVLLGAEFSGFKFGLSYDLNVFSDLQRASNSQGGAEFSLVYEFDCEPMGRRGYPPVTCPRF